MYKLYHHSICPASRMVRFLMSEIGQEYVLFEEKYWEDNDKFLRINQMGNVPVLITPDGTVLNHIQLILEHIHANYDQEIMYPTENNILDTKKNYHLV